MGQSKSYRRARSLPVGVVVPVALLEGSQLGGVVVDELLEEAGLALDETTLVVVGPQGGLDGDEGEAGLDGREAAEEGERELHGDGEAVKGKRRLRQTYFFHTEADHSPSDTAGSSTFKSSTTYGSAPRAHLVPRGQEAMAGAVAGRNTPLDMHIASTSQASRVVSQYSDANKLSKLSAGDSARPGVS